MTDFSNRSNFANERNAAAQARDEARRAKAEADRADSKRRAEDRKKDREEKADMRLTRDKESQKPDNSARSDKRDALWKSENYTETRAPSFARDHRATKDFPFALYPGQDGRTCVFFGQLIHHRDKTRFEKIFISAMEETCGEFNTLFSQDSIDPPTSHPPLNLKSDYGYLRETELNWRGDFYLYWETDSENDVTMCEIRGPSAPDSEDFPQLEFDLTRNFAPGTTGGKYFIKIGSVDDDGNVVQNISSDYNWCPSGVFPIGSRTISIPHGGNLDLIIRKFDIDYDATPITITIPAITASVSDPGHSHTVTIDSSGEHSHSGVTATMDSGGAHHHDIEYHSHEYMAGTLGTPTQTGAGFLTDNLAVNLDRTGSYESYAWNDDGAHTHEIDVEFSGSDGAHGHTGSTNNVATGISVEILINGESQGTLGTEIEGASYDRAKLVASTEMATILCWRNGDFYGSYQEGDELPDGTAVQTTIYVWAGA